MCLTHSRRYASKYQLQQALYNPALLEYMFIIIIYWLLTAGCVHFDTERETRHMTIWVFTESHTHCMITCNALVLSGLASFLKACAAF